MVVQKYRNTTFYKKFIDNVCFTQTPLIYSQIYGVFFNILLNNIYLEYKNDVSGSINTSLDLYNIKGSLPKSGLVRLRSGSNKFCQQTLFVLSKSTLNKEQMSFSHVHQPLLSASWNNTALNKTLFI